MKKRIAIIDDDPDFRSAVRMILESAGYACVEAASAEEGYILVETSAPDLVLLDVMMEDISSGFRFAKRLHEDGGKKKKIPILIISNVQKLTSLNFQSEKPGRRIPFDGFLDKPVKPDELVMHVERLTA